MNILKVFSQSGLTQGIQFFEDPSKKYDFGVSAGDFADCLGLELKALFKLIDDEYIYLSPKQADLLLDQNPYPDGIPSNVPVIWEYGIYQGLSRTKSKVAEPFQNWLFKDVIPSIRKTGRYGPPPVKQAQLLKPKNQPYWFEDQYEKLWKECERLKAIAANKELDWGIKEQTILSFAQCYNFHQGYSSANQLFYWRKSVLGDRQDIIKTFRNLSRLNRGVIVKSDVDTFFVWQKKYDDCKLNDNVYLGQGMEGTNKRVVGQVKIVDGYPAIAHDWFVEPSCTFDVPSNFPVI